MTLLLLIQIIFYGILEGITEWLPVSSTGHLILFESFWPIEVDPGFLSMFRVVIQLGAILAVCVLYFNKLNPFSRRKSIREKRNTWAIWGKVVVGTVPAAVAGFFLDDYFDAHFYRWQVVAGALIVYGIAFIVIEAFNRDRRFRVRRIEEMTYPLALFVGLFQVLSLIPGTSRSGVTILGAMLLGLSRTAAAEYSFFLAIPVMFGASLLKLVKYGLAFTGSQLVLLLTGMVVAFLVSVAAIRFLLGYIRKYSFRVFGWYRIVLGAAVIAVAILVPGLLP